MSNPVLESTIEMTTEEKMGETLKITVEFT